MKKLVALALLSLLLFPAVTATAAPNAVLCVKPGGADGCQASIQAAVDAASTGDTINVGPGLYPEQVVITKTLTIAGAGAISSTIQAPVSIPAASSPDSTIVKIAGAGVNVEMSGFTVAGPGPSGCGSILAGVMVRDGAAVNFHNNKVVDIRDNPMSGCQNGIGILVGRTAWSTSGTATLTNNIFQGYQKGGIVVDGASSSATITGNTVTGVGPTSGIAQNGIQLSRGATGTVSGNTVTGNVWTGTYGGSNDPVSDPDADGSTGILPYFSGALTISGNTLTNNQFGIWSVGATSLNISGNAITGTVTGGNVYAVGIAISDSDQWASSEVGTTGSLINNLVANHRYGLMVQDYVAGGSVPSPRVGGATCSQANTFTNDDYAVWFAAGSAYTLDARNNYWNEFRSDPEIAGLIWDHVGNPSLGTVLYRPYCAVYNYYYPFVRID